MELFVTTRPQNVTFRLGGRSFSLFVGVGDGTQGLDQLCTRSTPELHLVCMDVLIWLVVHAHKMLLSSLAVAEAQ